MFPGGFFFERQVWPDQDPRPRIFPDPAGKKRRLKSAESVQRTGCPHDLPPDLMGEFQI